MDTQNDAATFESINKVAESLRAILPVDFAPEVGIICGSGLSELQKAIKKPRYEIPYHKIKGFPVSTVPGHAGILVFGFIGASDTPAVLMNGRSHYYEGNTLQSSTLPIRVLRVLGITTCIITNAAGGLNPEYRVGDVVVMNDHINFPGLAGNNPLRGPNLTQFGPRFIPLSDAYDLELRRIAHLAWKELSKTETNNMKLHEGVYAFVGGPNYETRAECRMLSKLGADVVGMSTVPEIIVARHCGLQVLALSLVTNSAVLEPSARGDDPRLAQIGADELSVLMSRGQANHEEVMEASRSAAEAIRGLIVKIVEIEKGASSTF